MLVFPRLVHEGWLTLDELDGIGEEKIEVFRRLQDLSRK
jgi:hypothetical protein